MGQQEEIGQEEIRNQLWYCDSCNQFGVVNYRLHADFYEVTGLIGRAHSSASPKCDNHNGISYVRVFLGIKEFQTYLQRN